MATLLLTSPRKGNPIMMMDGDADENDGMEFANQRAISDYLDEVNVTPMSKSKSRNQGFGLLHSRTQLLKVNALYDDEEEDEQRMTRSFDMSKDYSLDEQSRDQSDFYLKSCVSNDDTRNSMSPLYAASSASSTVSSSSADPEDYEDESDESEESEFLIEARASLKALEEWDNDATIPTHEEEDHRDTISSCDASCNSSYNENLETVFDSQSACEFDDFRGPLGKNRSCGWDTPRSCPDIYARKRSIRPVSTKSWLQEIKDQEMLQRKRIAGVIAANNANSPHQTPSTDLRRRRSTSKSVFFRNKENLENISKQGSFSEKKRGGNKLIRSIRRSWASPAPFARSKRQSRGDEDRDDRNNATPNPVQATGQMISPQSSQGSSLATPMMKEKELQLKRAMLGSARVLTMDGIVESFANDPGAVASAKQFKSSALEQPSGGKQLSFAPTTDAPLTWV